MLLFFQDVESKHILSSPLYIKLLLHLLLCIFLRVKLRFERPYPCVYLLLLGVVDAAYVVDLTKLLPRPLLLRLA